MRLRGNLYSAINTLRKRAGLGMERAFPDAGRDLQVVDAELLDKLDRLSLVVGRDLITGLMGEHLAQRRTSGIEFADYRAYSPGDDLRRVDWNAFARSGTLHVRQAQAEPDTVLYMLVDASPSMDFGKPTKFLSARRLAAALGYIALSHLDNVVVAAPGAQTAGVRLAASGIEETVDSAQRNPSPVTQPLQSLRGRAEAGNLFRYLQGLETGTSISFDNLLAGWGSGGRARGRLAVIISDLLLDEYKEGVRQLALAGFQVTLIHMLAPEEIEPPSVGDLELTDSETGERFEVHMGEESTAHYVRNLDSWLAETEEWCARQGAGYLLVRSNWDADVVLLEALRRRGVTA